MSIFALGEESADKLSSLAMGGFPVFPGEHPTKAQLEPWLDAWTEDLNTSGFGAFTRGEIPVECLKLKVTRALLAVPSDAAAAAVIDAKNADITAANDAMKDEFDSKLVELKNRLAGKLSRAMRPHAKVRLKALLSSCKIGSDGSYDGEKMWKALVALKNDAESDADMKVHQKTVERLRDTPLDNNCSPQDWEVRMTEFQTSNDLTSRPLDGEELTKVYLGMMPECMGADQRRVKANLISESKMDDPVYASKKIVKEISDVHKPGQMPTVNLTAKQFADMAATIKAEAKAAAVAAASGGHSAPKKPKEKGKERKGARWAQKLPHGQKCAKGTCVYKHKDDVQCWRDPRVKLVLHGTLYDDPEMLESIQRDRATEARRLGCDCQPVERRSASVPAAAAAVPGAHAATPPLTIRLELLQ